MAIERIAPLLREGISKYQKMDSLYVIDPDGMEIYDTDLELGSAMQLVNLADRQYFQEAMLGNTYISEPVVSKTTGNLIMIISSPIYSEDGKIIGVMANAITTKMLNEIIKVAEIGKTGESYLVDNKGVFLTPSRYSDDLKRQGLITNQTELEMKINSIGYQKAIKGQDGVEEYVNYRGVKVIGAYTQVKIFNINWIILLEQEVSEAYIEINNLRNMLVVFALLLFSAILFFSALFSRQLTRPILHITEISKLVAQGNLELKAQVNSGNEIGALANTFNHMTEKLKITLEELRKSEEKYREIFENAVMGVYQISFEGTLLNINPACAHILGYESPKDLITSVKSVRKQLFTCESDFETFLRHILENERIIEREFQFYKKDGQTFWGSINARLIRDESGEPLHIEGFITDVTERKLAEEKINTLNTTLEQRVQERTYQLEIANHDLEAFAYSVSHDLRAPLRSIEGFSEALQEDSEASLNETSKSYLHRIIDATGFMAKLIENILKLSRVTQIDVNKSEVDLSKSARKIVAELQAAQPERQVEVIIPETLIVQGDPDLLYIALTNLISNAWKFTNKKKAARIELGYFTEEETDIYFVKDNGAGFDMKFVDRLFEAFQRLHSRTDFEGTGVGLTIVKRIVQRHGGRIWAQGVIDQGATFYFTLK